MCVQIDLSVEEVKRNAKKFSAALSVTNQPRAMEAFMRAHHVIAVAAALVIGLGSEADIISTYEGGRRHEGRPKSQRKRPTNAA